MKSRNIVIAGAMVFVCYLILAIVPSFAYEPMTREQLLQYRKDGSLPSRIAAAKAIGNYKAHPELVLRFRNKISRMVSQQKKSRPQSVDVLAPPSPDVLPSRGTINILVLLISFNDFPAVISQEEIQQKFFGDGDSADYPQESLRNYYQRSSYNQLNIQGNVLPWYQTSFNRSEVDQTDAGRDGLIRGVINYYDSHGHDFAQYDNDGDGDIDYFCVIWTGDHLNNWGKFWWGYYANYKDGDFSVDGKSLSNYSWQWEREQYPSGAYYPSFFPRTVIHETGHALGLPDLYDYDDYEVGGRIGPDGGVGWLDMMDHNLGDHNCFSKFMLDWITPQIAPTGNSTITLRPSGTYPDALLLMPSTTTEDIFTEYFMVQNRKRVGNDDGLFTGADGLLLWHIDATLNPLTNDFLYTNSHAPHKLVKLMQADGLEEIECLNEYADWGDYYRPGNEFGPNTIPNSARYNVLGELLDGRDATGSIAGVGFRNINSTLTSLSLDVQVEGVEVRQSSLVLNRQGSVFVDVRVPEDNEYYVRIWDDDGYSSPKWSWGYTSTSPVYLGALETHTFVFPVQPEDLSGTFECWLYKKDFLGLYKVHEKVQTTLYATMPDTEPPTVLMTQAGASRYTNIRITFNEAMDLLSLNNSNVHAIGSASGESGIACDFDRQTDTLIVNPESPFSFGETVNVTIGTGVMDVSGNHLQSPYQFSFDIESDPADDNVAPNLIFTAPSSEEMTDSGYYVVRWTDADPDSNALIRLFYDTDKNHENGYTIIRDENDIAASIYEDSSQNSFFWDTASVSIGTYYVAAVLEDYVNPPVIKYSSGTVQVKRPSSGTHFQLSSQSSWVWDDDNSGNAPGHINGIPEGMETLEVNISIRNSSGEDIKFVYGTLSSIRTQIDFDDGDDFIYYGNVASGQYVEPDGDFSFFVNAASLAGTPFTLHLDYQDLSGNRYFQNIDFSYTFPAQGELAPNLIVDSIQIVDSASGDGDGVFESGERIDFFVRLRNTGTAVCIDPRGVLEQSTAWGDEVFTDLTANYPDIQPDESATSATALDTDITPMGFAGTINTPLRIWYGPNHDIYQDVTVNLTVVPTPHIKLLAEAYDFGLIAPGASLEYVVTVRNRGSGNLIISGIDPNLPDTTVSGITFPSTIPPLTTSTFTMSVNTTSLNGFITRTLTIHSNAYGQPATPFTMTGTVTAVNPSANYVKLWENSIARDLNNVVVSDTDSDGRIEIVAATSGKIDNTVPVPACIQIYEKVGDDDFQLVPTGILSDLGGVPATHSLALGDFNKNGYMDIVVLASSQYISGSSLPFRVLRYEATGNDTWVQRAVAFSGGTTYGYTAMTVGDADDDGNLEILVARQGNENPQVLDYEWNGSGFTLRWTSPVVLGRDEGNVDSVPVIKVADSDGDGHSEIIFATDDAQIYIYESPAVDSFPSQTPVLSYEPIDADYLGTYPLKDFVVADTDNDGRNEIVHVSEDEYLFIMESTGDNTWNTAAPETYLLPDSMDGTCVAVGDTDNDGANEIVVGGDGSTANSHLCIYETIAENSHAVSWRSSEAEVNNASCSIALLNTNATPQNEIVIMTEAAGFPVLAYQESVDLQIVSNNINFDPGSVVEGGTVSITALVQNLSLSLVNDILVRFYDGDPSSGGTQIGADRIIASVPGSSAASVQVDWQPLISRNYQVFVVVDPDGTIPETDDSVNNRDEKAYFVLDNDTVGPQISNVVIAEYGGDGDGAIESNEQVRISWTAADVSGIGAAGCDIDGTVYAATGSYEVIAGPFGPDVHNYIITVQDSDNSPALSQESGSFRVNAHAIGVTQVSPLNGAVNVTIRPAVEAVFDSPLDPATISNATVVLRDPSLQITPGSISYNPVGNIITFIPSRDLTNSMAYTMTLSGGAGGILSETGNGLESSFVWSFTIEADTVAPVAVITSPTEGQNVNGAIEIRGTAWDLNFLHYQVFYGIGSDPTSWTEITPPITTSVTGNLLCQWDTTSLEAGPFTIMLVAQENPPSSLQAQDLVLVNIESDPHIPISERQALVGLYNATGGDNWTNNTGWKTPPLHSDGFSLPGTENGWHGITCNAGQTHVVGIDLSWNNLTGTIPVQLGDLTYLESLNLFFNSIDGSIPPQLGNLMSLTYLDLGLCRLSGGIPAELGNLTNLTVLSFSTNNLSGPIPSELGQLTNLLQFNLGFNALLDPGPIPDFIRGMTQLRWLVLAGTRRSGMIPAWLGELGDLVDCNLSRNELTGSIPDAVGDLTQLLYLNLNSNRLSGELTPFLGALPHLVNGASDLGYNALYSNDEALIAFINLKDPDWALTQTVAPTDVSAVGIGANTVQVSWTPIAYTADPGGYRVFWSETSGGPYAFAGQTATKGAMSLAVTGLMPATPYFFTVQTRTEAHANNANIVDSGPSGEAGGATLAQALIMGTVMVGGAPLPNVALAGLPSSPMTNPSGVYHGLVDIGWSGTVTPTLNGYTFEPPSRTYVTVASDVLAQDYAAMSVPATVAATSPNGGETFAAGSIHNVTWTTTGTIENVRIEYSINNGSDWLTVVDTTANTGTYSWRVPGPASTGCLVRVSDAANAAVADTSDAVFRIVVKEDLLATWDGQGVYYRNSDTGGWIKLASPATQVTTGDLDCDGIDDIIGAWPSQGGVWAKLSTNGWVRLSSTTPRDIAAGDMDGDGCDELIGTWDDQGVYMLTSIGGSWIKLASPATLIAVGNLDCDDKAELIGIWPGQGGVWVKVSSTGAWIRLGSTPRHIAAGDMDGDGCDELLGTWDGQGVFYLTSIGGAWVKMASPADLITCGDLDANGTDDLIGIWPTQGGVWVKYSSDGTWARLSSTARDISAGVMRAQGMGGAAADAPEGMMMMAAGQALEELPLPTGGNGDGPETALLKQDLSDLGPGGSRFVFIKDLDLEPSEDPAAAVTRMPGPGEPGFVADEQKDIIPGERLQPRKESGAAKKARDK